MFELDLNLKCHIDCKLGQWYHDIWMKSHYSDGWGDMGWHVVRSLSFGDTLHYGLMGAHFVNSAHQIPRDFFYTKNYSIILKMILKNSFDFFFYKNLSENNSQMEVTGDTLSHNYNKTQVHVPVSSLQTWSHIINFLSQ